VGSETTGITGILNTEKTQIKLLFKAYIQSLPYEQRGLLMMGPQQVPKNMRGSQ